MEAGSTDTGIGQRPGAIGGRLFEGRARRLPTTDNEGEDPCEYRTGSTAGDQNPHRHRRRLKWLTSIPSWSGKVRQNCLSPSESNPSTSFARQWKMPAKMMRRFRHWARNGKH